MQSKIAVAAIIVLSSLLLLSQIPPVTMMDVCRSWILIEYSCVENPSASGECLR